MVSKAPTSLAPGFRFHPTDEELVRYYLRRKICRKPFRFDAISEIDVYKAEPWDLPGMSKLKTRDLEWYFFSVLDKKYGNGSRTNRATERGYWKTTGKDRPVYHKSQVGGMKKTLVYHSGRAPRGQRTNWVMHEYRLIDKELEKAGIVQDTFVLCRVFQKSGSGPKNGEQYGAPFLEEEWEDDELEIVLKDEAAEEVEVGDDAYLDGNDLEQILVAEIPTDNVPLPLNCYPGENDTFVDETTESIDDSQKLLVGSGEYDNGNNQSDDQKPFHLPVQYDMHQKPVKHEYIGESSKTVDFQGVDYLLDEPYEDATNNLQFDDDGAFLETNDLSNPIEADAAGFDMLEEYLTFFDANGDIAFDPLTTQEGQDIVSGESCIAEKDVKEGIQPVMSSKQLEHYDDATSSKEVSSKFGSGYQYPFMRQASHMLGSIPAPPAFASEFPSKDVALRLNSASQPSSSAHVTTGMIRIRNMSMDSHGTDWLLGKQGQYNVTLSFGLSRGEDNSTTLESAVRIFPGKTISLGPSGWFYFIFFWVLLLSVSFKIGTLICAQ